MPNFPLNISCTQAAVSPGLYHVCGNAPCGCFLKFNVCPFLKKVQLKLVRKIPFPMKTTETSGQFLIQFVSRGLWEIAGKCASPTSVVRLPVVRPYYFCRRF